MNRITSSRNPVKDFHSQDLPGSAFPSCSSDLACMVEPQLFKSRTEAALRKAKKARRMVRFSTRTHIFLIPSVADMSIDDMAQTWWTDEENAKMQLYTLKVVKRMRKGLLSEDECTRGLDHMRSSESIEQRKINKDAVYQAVLEEQREQVQRNICDPNSIRNASLTCSKWARDKAAMSGVSDEAEAFSVYEKLHGRRCHSISETDRHCLWLLEQALKVTNDKGVGAQEPEPKPSSATRLSRLASSIGITAKLNENSGKLKSKRTLVPSQKKERPSLNSAFFRMSHNDQNARTNALKKEKKASARSLVDRRSSL